MICFLINVCCVCCVCCQCVVFHFLPHLRATAFLAHARTLFAFLPACFASFTALLARLHVLTGYAPPFLQLKHVSFVSYVPAFPHPSLGLVLFLVLFLVLLALYLGGIGVLFGCLTTCPTLFLTCNALSLAKHTSVATFEKSIFLRSLAISRFIFRCSNSNQIS